MVWTVLKMVMWRMCFLHFRCPTHKGASWWKGASWSCLHLWSKQKRIFTLFCSFNHVFQLCLQQHPFEDLLYHCSTKSDCGNCGVLTVLRKKSFHSYKRCLKSLIILHNSLQWWIQRLLTNWKQTLRHEIKRCIYWWTNYPFDRSLEGN